MVVCHVFTWTAKIFDKPMQRDAFQLDTNANYETNNKHVVKLVLIKIVRAFSYMNIFYCLYKGRICNRFVPIC